ncbi:hypothetical protein H6G81_34785 [Scytonema hofmannii FACHB-248]|uniref:Uncharacterized protein n=1 Tax=Scytonema hofmannii FACHB-248 TaxID=1842502 RepID=A0ABR8H228_9CYAN|nr:MULTISPECIES: hypothetical protein [Nostocales]MBD2609519.1 hypothetical protein [Scytonema hofmannii FACHB-248]
MNNAELLRTLNRNDLLSVVELLSAALKFPDEDFEELEGYTGYLPEEVFERLKVLTEYERLKLMQKIINTLVHEAEQSTVRYFQTPWSRL